MRAIPTSHILMDSWFFSDFLVRKLNLLGLQSICLVKSKTCHCKSQKLYRLDLHGKY